MDYETIELLVRELENIRAIIQNLNVQYALTPMDLKRESQGASLLPEIQAAEKAISRIGQRINLLHDTYTQPGPNHLN